MPIETITDDWVHTNNKIKTKHGERSINLFKSCIHADLHDDNVLFNNEETMQAALVDFVDMYYSWDHKSRSTFGFWVWGQKWNKQVFTRMESNYNKLHDKTVIYIFLFSNDFCSRKETIISLNLFIITWISWQITRNYAS